MYETDKTIKKNIFILTVKWWSSEAQLLHFKYLVQVKETKIKCENGLPSYIPNHLPQIVYIYELN